MTAKKIMGRVVSKNNLAGSYWAVGINLSEMADFLPGQFVSIKVNEEGFRRSYSIASLPKRKSLELVVDVSPMGEGSKFISRLEIGDSVEMLGYLGKFFVDEKDLSLENQLVFVGTGSGVVPLKPMIEDLLIRRKFLGQIYLIWGMRFEKDLFWLGDLFKLTREYKNFHFDIVLSVPGEKWSGSFGHVGDVVADLSILGKQTRVFLCGNPEMVTEMKEVFVKRGVSEEKILYELFA